MSAAITLRRLLRPLRGLLAAICLVVVWPALALAMGDDALNQSPTQTPTCPTGQIFNAQCNACAKTCPTGLVWDCDKKACVQKTSRRFSDEELYAYAVTLIKEERHAEARDLLWLVADREQPKVLTYIGYTTRKLGDVDTGIAYYRKALALDPNYTRARAYLGEGYLQKGDVERAKGELIEIARRCGTNCPEYAALGDAIALYLSGEPLPKGW